MTPAQINHLRTLISQDNLSKAVAELITLTKDGDHGNEAIQFSAQLTAVEKQERMGLISFSEASQQRNRISYGLLSLLATLKPTPNDSGASEEGSSSGGIKNQFNGSTFNGPVTFNNGSD